LDDEEQSCERGSLLPERQCDRGYGAPLLSLVRAWRHAFAGVKALDVV